MRQRARQRVGLGVRQPSEQGDEAVAQLGFRSLESGHTRRRERELLATAVRRQGRPLDEPRVDEPGQELGNGGLRDARAARELSGRDGFPGDRPQDEILRNGQRR